MELFSRTAYCEKCAKEKLPDNGTLFAVIQGTGKQVVVLKVESIRRRRTPVGFTPHFVSLLKVKNGEAIVAMQCGVIGCGSVIETEYDQLGNPTYDVGTIEARRAIMTIEDWNSLVLNFRDTGYEI